MTVERPPRSEDERLRQDKRIGLAQRDCGVSSREV
jgi:hypothetical protein